MWTASRSSGLVDCAALRFARAVRNLPLRSWPLRKSHEARERRQHLQMAQNWYLLCWRPLSPSPRRGGEGHPRSSTFRWSPPSPKRSLFLRAMRLLPSWTSHLSLCQKPSPCKARKNKTSCRNPREKKIPRSHWSLQHNQQQQWRWKRRFRLLLMTARQPFRMSPLLLPRFQWGAPPAARRKPIQAAARRSLCQNQSSNESWKKLRQMWNRHLRIADAKVACRRHLKKRRSWDLNCQHHPESLSWWRTTVPLEAAAPALSSPVSPHCRAANQSGILLLLWSNRRKALRGQAILKKVTPQRTQEMMKRTTISKIASIATQ